MMLRCDGCGRMFDANDPREPAVEGQRANGMFGGGLPDGDFHWCTRCAEVGFRAVREAARSGSDRVVSLPRR